MQLEDHLTQDQLDQLRAKEKELVKQSDEIVENLRQGGKKAVLGIVIVIHFFYINTIAL